jgi:hypothetical protein
MGVTLSGVNPKNLLLTVAAAADVAQAAVGYCLAMAMRTRSSGSMKWS